MHCYARDQTLPRLLSFFAGKEETHKQQCGAADQSEQQEIALQLPTKTTATTRAGSNDQIYGKD